MWRTEARSDRLRGRAELHRADAGAGAPGQERRRPAVSAAVALDVSQRGKGYLTLTEARYDSPLLKLFKSPDAADLGKIHFTRLYLTTEPDKRAEVLLKFEDGTPAAARRNFGAGSILVCNFSTSPADSDLPRQEFFPPLLHEFLKGLTDKGGDRREFYPGGSASTTLDADQVRSASHLPQPQQRTGAMSWWTSRAEA